MLIHNFNHPDINKKDARNARFQFVFKYIFYNMLIFGEKR